MVVAALSYIQYKQWKAVAALLPIISDLLKWRRDLKIADPRCRRQNSLSKRTGGDASIYNSHQHSIQTLVRGIEAVGYLVKVYFY